MLPADKFSKPNYILVELGSIILTERFSPTPVSGWVIDSFRCSIFLHLKALLGVLLPLLGQDDDVLPDGGEPLLEQLDHGSLLPQILQLLGVSGETKNSDVKVKLVPCPLE